MILAREVEQNPAVPTDSRIMTEYSTEEALPSLTLEIKRDPVRSRRYDCSGKDLTELAYKQLPLSKLLSIDEYADPRSAHLCKIAGRLHIRPPESRSIGPHESPRNGINAIVPSNSAMLTLTHPAIHKSNSTINTTLP